MKIVPPRGMFRDGSAVGRCLGLLRASDHNEDADDDPDDPGYQNEDHTDDHPHDDQVVQDEKRMQNRVKSAGHFE